MLLHQASGFCCWTGAIRIFFAGSSLQNSAQTFYSFSGEFGPFWLSCFVHCLMVIFDIGRPCGVDFSCFWKYLLIVHTYSVRFWRTDTIRGSPQTIQFLTFMYTSDTRHYSSPGDSFLLFPISCFSLLNQNCIWKRITAVSKFMCWAIRAIYYFQYTPLLDLPLLFIAT